MPIQVPKGKSSVEVSAAAAAALVDSRTRTSFEPPPTEPSSSTEPPSTTPTEPSSKPPSKEQQAVSAAVAMKCFEETVNPKDYPTLLSKTISLQTDKDIALVLQPQNHEVMKKRCRDAKKLHSHPISSAVG